MRQCLSYYHICAHEYLGFLCQSLHLGVVFPVCLLLVIVVGQETHQFIPVEQKVKSRGTDFKSCECGVVVQEHFCPLSMCNLANWGWGGCLAVIFIV